MFLLLNFFAILVTHWIQQYIYYVGTVFGGSLCFKVRRSGNMFFGDLILQISFVQSQNFHFS